MRAFPLQVFNPPYVPTPNEELDRTDIARAWAGGLNGRVVIDLFLPFVSHARAWLCTDTSVELPATRGNCKNFEGISRIGKTAFCWSTRAGAMCYLCQAITLDKGQKTISSGSNFTAWLQVTGSWILGGRSCPAAILVYYEIL